MRRSRTEASTRREDDAQKGLTNQGPLQKLRVQRMKARRSIHHRYAEQSGIPCAMVLTISFVISPVIGYSIHTFWSFRVVPYLMRRKASRPKRMIFGPGLP